MTSDIIISALISSIPPTMMATLAWYATIRNGHKADKIAEVVTEVKAQTDGLTNQLVNAEKVNAKAAGKLEERAEVADRKGNPV